MRAVRFIGACGGLSGLLLVPPVFERLFALVRLAEGDAGRLWFGSLVMLGLSAIFLFGAPRWLSGAAALFGVLVVLVAAELCTRLVVVVGADPSVVRNLAEVGREGSPYTAGFASHPFVSHLGNPSAPPLVARGRDGGRYGRGYNNFGFADDDFLYPKPMNTTRVACLGGSTTESGYPHLLERVLNERFADSRTRFEVLNFGLGGWSTAHSLVNYALNVVDFEPDFVVIHHAWNDAFGHEDGCELRGDYWGLVPEYTPAPPVEGSVVRASVLYRVIKERLFPAASWTYRAQVAVPHEHTASGEGGCADTDPLWPYERNIQSMITLATARGTTVVLTTQPHYVDTGQTTDWFDETVAAEMRHIDACNTAVRSIAGSADNDLLFVDLDHAMTGPMNDHFLDLGHLDEEGKLFKAEGIADAIAARLAEGASPSVPAANEAVDNGPIP